MRELGVSAFCFRYIRSESYAYFLKKVIDEAHECNVQRIEVPIEEDFCIENAYLLKFLAWKYNLRYSIHLPKDIINDKSDEGERLAKKVAVFTPDTAVIHLYRKKDLDQYYKLKKRFEEYNCKLCVEMLSYTAEERELTHILKEKDIDIVMDLQHCLGMDNSYVEIMQGYNVQHIHIQNMRSKESEWKLRDQIEDYKWQQLRCAIKSSGYSESFIIETPLYSHRQLSETVEWYREQIYAE